VRAQVTRLDSRAGRQAPEVDRGAYLVALVVCCLACSLVGFLVGFFANVDHWYRAMKAVGL
jgi:hypothetical protein